MVLLSTTMLHLFLQQCHTETVTKTGTHTHTHTHTDNLTHTHTHTHTDTRPHTHTHTHTHTVFIYPSKAPRRHVVFFSSGKRWPRLALITLLQCANQNKFTKMILLLNRHQQVSVDAVWTDFNTKCTYLCLRGQLNV